MLAKFIEHEVQSRKAGQTIEVAKDNSHHRTIARGRPETLCPTSSTPGREAAPTTLARLKFQELESILSILNGPLRDVYQYRCEPQFDLVPHEGHEKSRDFLEVGSSRR